MNNSLLGLKKKKGMRKFVSFYMRVFFRSAKENKIIGDDVTLEEFKKTSLGDVLRALKEKGINELKI